VTSWKCRRGVDWTCSSVAPRGPCDTCAWLLGHEPRRRATPVRRCCPFNPRVSRHHCLGTTRRTAQQHSRLRGATERARRGSSQHRLAAPAAAAQSRSPQPAIVQTGRVEQRVRPPPRARRAGRSPDARRSRAVGMCGARPARASIEVGEQRRVSRLHRAWA
jgi:hypothetical protein